MQIRAIVHWKSVTKDMSKAELWKEQTGWRLGNAFNNNKKSIDFWLQSCNESWKTHFIWRIYICCRQCPIHYYSFFACLKTSFLSCRPELTRNIICLPLFWLCPLVKFSFMCWVRVRPGTVQTSNDGWECHTRFFFLASTKNFSHKQCYRLKRTKKKVIFSLKIIFL